MNTQKRTILLLLGTTTLVVSTWVANAGSALFGQVNENDLLRDIVIREQGDTAFISFRASPYMCYSVRRNGGNIGTICGAEEKVTAQMEYVIAPDAQSVYQFCEIQADINREPRGCILSSPDLSLSKEEVRQRSRPPEISEVSYDNKIMTVRYKKTDDLCYSLNGKRSRVYSSSVPGMYELPLCDSGEGTMKISVGAADNLQTIIRLMEGKYVFRICALYEDACSTPYVSDPRDDFAFGPDGNISLEVIEGGMPYTPINYIEDELILNYTKYSSRCFDLYGVPNTGRDDYMEYKKLVVKNVCKNGSRIPLGFGFENISPDLFNPGFVACYSDMSKCSNVVLPDYFAIKDFCEEPINATICGQIGQENMYLHNQDEETFEGPITLGQIPINPILNPTLPTITDPPLIGGTSPSAQCPSVNSFAELALACEVDNDCPRVSMPAECTLGPSGDCQSKKFAVRCVSGTCELSSSIAYCEPALCVENFREAAPPPPYIRPEPEPEPIEPEPIDGTFCSKNVDCGVSTCSSVCSLHEGICAKDCIMPLCMNNRCIAGNVIKLCPDDACRP